MDDPPNQRLPVSDLGRYERLDGALAARSARRARFLGEIVAAGSMLGAGGFQQSTLACRRRPGRRPCGGHIRLGRDPLSDEIQWQCATCGDGGSITNWQHTRWDLSEALACGHVVSLSAERARRQAEPQAVARAFEIEIELVSAPVQLHDRQLRRVCVAESATLHELHEAIARAFDRVPAREPFEFMFGPTRTVGARRDDPLQPWEAQRLDELGLREGDTFGYLYDFADEWVHRLTVVGTPRGLPGERTAALPSPERSEPPVREVVLADLEPATSLTTIYGPYRAEVGPVPEDWLALDDLERQILALEAHVREVPANHPPIPSLLLHALVHSLAETELAELGESCPEDEPDRHAFVHRLGEALARALLTPDTIADQPRKRSRRRDGDPSEP